MSQALSHHVETRLGTSQGTVVTPRCVDGSLAAVPDEEDAAGASSAYPSRYVPCQRASPVRRRCARTRQPLQSSEDRTAHRVRHSPLADLSSLANPPV